MNVSPLVTFQEHCARRELAYQVDGDGAAVFPPRVVAPACGGALEWRVSKGVGSVYSTTTISPRGKEPYNVATIALDEGFRMMSRVEGIAPDEVRIGLRVRVRFIDATDEQPAYPVFEPETHA